MAMMYPITSLLSLTLTFLLLTLTYQVQGNGYLRQPSARNSRWTVLNDGSPADYDHMCLNCGGKYVQYNQNYGKCGPCGDNFGNTRPRAHEAGGTYVPASRTVVATYTQGQVIGVTVTITASHLGYFEFRLCQVNNFSANIYQNCLDQNVLKIAGTLNTRYMPPGGGIDANGDYSLNLQLPDNVHCELCVLQWLYNTGNSHGTDDNGNYCLGCGDQEQFINCADIAIAATSSTSTFITGTTSTPSPTTSSTTSSTTTSNGGSGDECLLTPYIRSTISRCTVTTTYAAVNGMEEWCITNCRAGYCPYTHCEICYCTASSPTTSSTVSSTAASTTTTSPTTSSTVSSTAPSTTTTSPSTSSTTSSTSTSSTTSSSEQYGAVCLSTPYIRATISRCTVTTTYADAPWMVQWCITNCRAGYCPYTHCEICYCPAY